MADKNTADKNELKALKEAEKAAKKAKQERIKASKPKKEGNVFSRSARRISKFFKDFAGTCKKIVWPAAPQVLKNSAIVLAVITVVGLVIFGFDQGLTALFGLGTDIAVEMGEQFGGEETTAEDETAADEETTVEETTVEDVTEEDTTAQEDTTAE